MMGLLNWFVDLLRDSIWNGIVGVIAVVTLLVTLVRFAINLVRGIKVQQGLISTLNKTIAEVASLIRKVTDFVLTRGWRVHVLASVIIFLAIWGQHRSTPEIATTLGILTVVCWLLFRAAYLTNSEVRKLREGSGTHEPECLPLDDIAVADDFARRYPVLQPGKRDFNGIPFLLSRRYFDTSATQSRVLQLQIKPVTGVSAVHLLVNAGNAWRRHRDTDLSGVVLGRVLLWFTGEVSQEIKLTLGVNVREWAPGNKPGELVDQVTDPLSQEAWASKSGVQNLLVLDHLEIPIQTRYKSKALERIVISKDTTPNAPEDILAFSIFAVTLEH